VWQHCVVLCCAVLCRAVQVVSAHAASIGDNLLGVPLNCSAGLHADAVGLLQEAGLWQAAAALTARTLTGTERAQALSRFAQHVQQHEGSTWRCVGILTAAGCLQAAAQVGHSAALIRVVWQAQPAASAVQPGCAKTQPMLSGAAGVEGCTAS
jgi:hypothetical protein